jgi:hypothetical protein
MALIGPRASSKLPSCLGRAIFGRKTVGPAAAGWRETGPEHVPAGLPAGFEDCPIVFGFAEGYWRRHLIRPGYGTLG